MMSLDPVSSTASASKCVELVWRVEFSSLISRILIFRLRIILGADSYFSYEPVLESEKWGEQCLDGVIFLLFP